ncbi:MAG: uncharacterized protein PWP65_1204 [Clostridia bacterium]|nr:uncharacterized protein [Clostridia bacterium]
MGNYEIALVLGMAAGFFCRLLLLRSDYRRYPGYPHGYVTHLSLAAVASLIGALAPLALIKREYTAVTFLALAAQQFREIRDMERKTLGQLEQNELVKRGQDYIEGIARVFEARNYLVMFTSSGSSLATYYLGWKIGLAVMVLFILISNRLKRGRFVRDIAEVVPVDFGFKGAHLEIDGVVIMNVGLAEAREKLKREALAVKLKPIDDDGRAILHDAGQRQAILHTVAAVIGSKREIGEPEWTPLARKNIDTGEILLFILPNEKDLECLIEAVKMTPVLESAVNRPLKSRIGRAAAD